MLDETRRGVSAEHSLPVVPLEAPDVRFVFSWDLRSQEFLNLSTFVALPGLLDLYHRRGVFPSPRHQEFLGRLFTRRLRVLFFKLRLRRLGIGPLLFVFRPLLFFFRLLLFVLRSRLVLLRLLPGVDGGLR